MAGDLKPEPGKARLLAIRAQVQQGWRDIGDALQRQGHSDLAAEVARFAERLPPALTDREHIARALMEHIWRNRVRVREEPMR